MHFIGIKWDDSSEQPSMNARDKKNQFSLREPITIKVSDKRICIGHYSHPEYKTIKCPHNVAVKDAAQCELCNRSDSKYFLSLNALNSDQLKVLKQQPHTNYIDFFGCDHLKTGVAANVRKNTRLLEQGATAGVFFAESDGIVSRQIETAISRALNLAQSVTWQTKIKLIKIDVSEEEAMELLKKVYLDICRFIPPEYKKYLKNEPEYTFKLDKYKKRIPIGLKSMIYVNKIRPKDIISGEVVGILGELIIIQAMDKSRQVYAMSSRALGGYHIEIENEVRDIKLSEELKSIDLEEHKPDQLTLF